MKTKKFKFKQLLKLHFLKSRVYEHAIKKTNFNVLIDANLDQVLVGVKKALQVIFQYNQTKKHILFIGLPSKLESKINSLTGHMAVPNSFNIHGIISNNHAHLLLAGKSSIKALSKKNSTIFSPKLAKKPDLIVLFDHEKSYSVVSEAWIAKIPIITFGVNNDSTDLFMNNPYCINGNFKSALVTFDKNIFFVGLNFLFRNLKNKKERISSDFSKSTAQPFIRNEKSSRGRSR